MALFLLLLAIHGHPLCLFGQWKAPVPLYPNQNRSWLQRARQNSCWFADCMGKTERYVSHAEMHAFEFGACTIRSERLPRNRTAEGSLEAKIMFQSLDEEIKLSQGRTPATRNRLLQYAGALCASVALFGALYLVARFLE